MARAVKEGPAAVARDETGTRREPFRHRILELKMKPGRLSDGGFLGPNEKLGEVLKADEEAVGRLGITHDRIADRIEHFIKAVVDEDLSSEGKTVDGRYLVGGTRWRGSQECPWGDSDPMQYSNMDLFVTNKKSGERVEFPGAIVHLIREHHFYEGRNSPYRVDPEQVARVLDVK